MDVITRTVDATGQSCPGPLVALARALREARTGDLFELLATDPGSRSDVPSWAETRVASWSRSRFRSVPVAPHRGRE